MKETITIEPWMTELEKDDRRVMAIALIHKRANNSEPISMNELASILETTIYEAIKLVNTLELERVIEPISTKITGNDFIKTYRIRGRKDESKDRFAKENSFTK